MSKLAFLFPLGPDGASIRSEKFEDVDFSTITDVLIMLDLGSWSHIPRTYAVLRLINRIEDINAFTTQKVSDLSIPYTKDNLPQSLSISTKSKFLQMQSFVLTSAMDLERGEAGRHRHISSLEDLQFDRIGELGRGGGCTHVEKVWSNVGRRPYAVKYIRRAQYFDNDLKALKDFETELQNAKKVVHHHVVKIVGSFTEELYVGIIMETVGEQNLAQLLRGNITVDTRSFLRTYFGCLASGIFAIHQADIKHKDIKPENVVIRKSVVYLTDFGLALDFSITPENRSTTIGKPSMKHTPLYCAPEWWDWSRRDRRSDIWSIGAVYLEMATVLFDESIPKLFDFLGQHGSQNVLSYSRNLVGIFEWVEFLRSKKGHERDTMALDLVLVTMKKSIDQRPTSFELWKLIEKSAARGVSFACRACVDSFNPPERESHDVHPQLPTIPTSSWTIPVPLFTTTAKQPGITSLDGPSSNLHINAKNLSYQNDNSLASRDAPPKVIIEPEEGIEPTVISDFSIVAKGKNLGIVSDNIRVSKEPSGQTNIRMDASIPKISQPVSTKSDVQSTVERDTINAFQKFADSQRKNIKTLSGVRTVKDKGVILSDLKKFAESFKLQTPIPDGLVSTLAKDPAKQKEIQEKALRNVQESKTHSDQETAQNLKNEQTPNIPTVNETQASSPPQYESLTSTISRLEYLFSDENLKLDYVFRACMDSEGFVPIFSIIHRFSPSIGSSTRIINLLKKASYISPLLEFLPMGEHYPGHVRRKNDPRIWVLPPERRMGFARDDYQFKPSLKYPQYAGQALHNSFGPPLAPSLLYYTGTPQPAFAGRPYLPPQASSNGLFAPAHHAQPQLQYMMPLQNYIPPAWRANTPPGPFHVTNTNNANVYTPLKPQLDPLVESTTVKKNSATALTLT
jgi:serine/threonine protein kinase